MSTNKGQASRFSQLHGGFFSLYDKRVSKSIRQLEPSYPRMDIGKKTLKHGKRRDWDKKKRQPAS